MSTKTIVMLREENGGDYGEIKVCETLEDAERHIEGLLEKGFEHKSIRLLEGSEREFVVRHRPVVSALPSDADLTAMCATEDAASMTLSAEELEDAFVAPAAEAWVEEPELIPVGVSSKDRPYTRDGVRFSSIFARA